MCLKHSSFATVEHCFACLTVIINNYSVFFSCRSSKSCWNPHTHFVVTWLSKTELPASGVSNGSCWALAVMCVFCIQSGIFEWSVKGRQSCSDNAFVCAHFVKIWSRPLDRVDRQELHLHLRTTEMHHFRKRVDNSQDTTLSAASIPYFWRDFRMQSLKWRTILIKISKRYTRLTF